MTTHRPLTEYSTAELELHRQQAVLLGGDIYERAELIIDQYGSDHPDRYPTRTYQRTGMEITVIKLPGNFDPQKMDYINRRRLIIKVNKLTVVNVILRDQGVEDEPGWARVVRGKWLSYLTQAADTAVLAREDQRSEQDTLQREKLLGLLLSGKEV
jgi:hypothetical protein